MSHLHEHVFALPRLGKEPRAGLLNLSSNELLHPKHDELIRQVMCGLRDTDVTRYPLYDQLLLELAEFLGVAPTNLLLSAGSDDAIKVVTEALATKSKSMLLQRPNYEGWETYALLRGVRVYHVTFGDPRPHRFSLEVFLASIDRQPPSLVVLSNPNGPTGFTYPLADLASIARGCAARGHLLAVDACYSAFASISLHELRHHLPHALVVQSLSKSFGVPGCRLAVILAPPTVIDYLARWQPQNAISGAAIATVRALLPRYSEIRAIHGEVLAARDWFAGELSRLFPRWVPLPSGGNFQCFVLRSDEEATNLSSYLRARGVRIKNASRLPGMLGTVRFTAADMDAMVAVLRLLRDFRYDG